MRIVVKDLIDTYLNVNGYTKNWLGFSIKTGQSAEESYMEIQFEDLPEVTRTKMQCQICGDKYADENLMLGYCCGLPMTEVPWTVEDYKKDLEKKKIINELLQTKVIFD